MAKRPSITPQTSRYEYTTLNDNLSSLQEGFDNTLSLDGSVPNAMQADLDLNSNDILNVGTLNTDDLIIDGVSINDKVTAAETFASEAEASATAAAASADRIDLGDFDSDVAQVAADRVQTGLDRASATASATTATTQAGLAQTARTAAEAARDAAQADANVYTSTAAGLAAVSEGGQFMVVVGDEIIRYEDVGGVATERARYPASSRVTTLENRLDASQTIGRAVTPITGSAITVGTYTFENEIAYSGTVIRIRAFSSTAVTIKVRRFTLLSGTMTQVGSDTDVALSSGLNNIDVSIPVNAGEHLGFYSPASGVTFTSATGDSGGYYFGAGDVTSYTDASAPRTTVRLQIGFDLVQPRITQIRLDGFDANATANRTAAADNASGLADVADAMRIAVESKPATLTFASTAFGEYAGALLLAGVPNGTILRELTLYRQFVASTATKVRLTIYQRPDAETTSIPNNCTTVFQQDYTLAELGLTAGGTDRPDVTFQFPVPFEKQSGRHLAWRAQALDGSDTPVAQSFGYLVDASATASERGWYRSTPSSGSWTANTGSNRMASAVARVGFTDAVGLSAAEATVSVSGTTVAVNGFLIGAGRQSLAFRGSLTPALAAAGKERMDLIQVDRSTLAVSLVAGSSRDTQLDSLEWQGAATANNLIVGRARVTDAAVQAVAVAGWRGLVKVNGEGDMARHVQRNRQILRRVIGKAMRGAAINLGGYGDSITALQSSTPTFAANGTMRDRGHTYLANYPSDSLALVPLLNTGDGAGTVHTRLGWNWDIKAALDEMAGSEVVTYLNYGIGGTTSQSTTNNGLDPSRIAVPIAAELDAVVIAFGMNERGQTYTYANIVNMIGQFQAVGTACVVFGCPRPNANQSLSAWRFTNNALEAASMDAGAAFVSTATIADDTTLGGIGVPAQALASANTVSGGNNHPGIWELRRYGQAAVTQLGL